MNSNNCGNGPSQNRAIAIESVEISIQTLIKNWYKRQQWHHMFNPRLSSPSKAPWRDQLAKFLESIQIRVLAISLLLADLILTVLELSSTLVSCSENVEKSAWFHWVGISILALLSAKMVALAVALGPGGFLRRPGYVVDGIVVVGALVLEAAVEAKGGGLLVIVSLWRVVRVVESAMELSDEAIEAQIEAIVCQFEALRDENSRLLDTIARKDQIIEMLEEEVNQYRHALDLNRAVSVPTD
ncbi:hypothetical protein like AT1G10800 [Hibiscus trionum]|uniref:Voltage-gated hydrogen channel 1 n=1 Tax=Hibiscus trionum TaxID=183268 RepID=A0A9W7M986_HIBTR|nr:hypothetical protein like AT1G10800 [Hibiscus trionum]